MNVHQSDVVIIGSGASGLSAALECAAFASVILISKGALVSGASCYAQGGIASALSQGDTPQQHAHDTHMAGGHLCYDQAVDHITQAAPSVIEWLAGQGVAFNQHDGHYVLGREGGHGRRRIVHSHDATGRVMTEALAERVLAHDRIQVVTDTIAMRLLGDAENCQGVECWDLKAQCRHCFFAKAVILATGGASKQYAYTTHDEVSSGDGIAMAWQLGCRIVDLEFQQFHPTCLYHPEAGALLLSEALRGEGGQLLGLDHKPFMARFDARGALAPRDIVARAIDHEMKSHGWTHVYLDMTHQDPSYLKTRFPMLYQACFELGFDMAHDPLPVVPAAHYTCGGVYVQSVAGQSDVPGLWAIGEVAATGVHGANRLASNSLLECVVMAQSLACALKEVLPSRTLEDQLMHTEHAVQGIEEPVFIPHDWHAIRHLMWDYVGIVRNERRLKQALARLEVIRDELAGVVTTASLDHHAIECNHLITVAWLTVQAALARKESRGLHARSDYPARNPSLDYKHSCLRKNQPHQWLVMD